MQRPIDVCESNAPGEATRSRNPVDCGGRHGFIPCADVNNPSAAVPRRSGLQSGFTLVEMLVVITVIAVLAAIALPVFVRVRENARDTTCRSNLRQIGQGLLEYSTRGGRFCSGAWDWKRDGAVTEVGWVADLVNQGSRPGDLLCPSSPYKASKVLHELLTMDPASNACADSIGGPDRTLPDGTVLQNPCRQLMSPTADKAKILEEHLLLKGFNTNYAASWFLVRSEVNIDSRGRLVNKNAGCAKGTRERSCTIGPLEQARIGGTKVPSNIVPIMGCANEADQGENVLTTQVGELPSGTQLAASYTTGPRDKTTLSVPQGAASGSGPSAWWGPWNNSLQDYRDFGPVHRGACNVLFADGGVRSFVDADQDGLLNNGFPASTVSGFGSDVIELPAAEIFSLWSLDPTRIP